jgi:WD40 repeat protein
MSDETVKALFLQALDVDAQQRGAFLDVLCAGDAGLRAAVAELLDFDAKAENAPSFLQGPVAGVRPPLSAPSFIGRYRLVRLLGEGGMGAVYEAEQDHPRRLVALKVIRPGLVSPTLLKRFMHEAEILGRLHHPGIAQIYEAGVAEDGKPFFALELIRGLPLDEYVRLRGVPTPARLELVARVCDAVQHAHDQGVIHRDLKPGNILVDDSGQPRVLDFGVARMTGADLLTTSDRTRTGQLVGTLSYMSPEQVTADPGAMDGRSDVYTLGVILFELLTGEFPYLLQDLPLPEAVRLIREHEPSRLGSIDTQLRGDVETIVAKALEKDPARRYPSAAELARDIRRHLRAEPILARPPSALYHLSKFARRHKAVVAAVLGIGLALASGTAVSVAYAIRAAENAREARENARQANENARKARYQTYRSRLAAAGAALQNYDVADAASQLKDTPEELRDWAWHYLHSRLDDSSSSLALPAGHGYYLFGGPEGMQVATATSAGLLVTDLDGRALQSIPRGPAPWWWAALSRRGPWVLEAPSQSSIRLRYADGITSASVNTPAVAISTANAVDPAWTRLAIAWAGLGILLYDTSSGKEIVRLADHAERISSLVFSPDGKQLVSTSDDHTARLWDVATGKRTAELRGHMSKVFGAAFRPDGARLLTSSADGTVRQWDALTGEPVEAPFDRHTGEVTAAVFSPDGRWIASGGTDRTVRLWQAMDRREVAVLRGHTGTVNAVAFTPDGRRLASIGDDRMLRIWEADSEAGLPVLRGHTSYVYAVAFSPDGQWIASGSWDRTVRLWDARTGEPAATFPHPPYLQTLAFSPDSSWLVTRDTDGGLEFRGVATGQLRKAARMGPKGHLHAVAVSPDGACIAALTNWGSLLVFEVASGRELLSDQISRDQFGALAFSPDGRWLAASGEDRKTIAIWNTSTYRRVASFAGHTGTVASIAFSRDGRRLVSASLDQTVRLWDMESGECQAILAGHTGEVFAAVFHPDGTRIASAGRDQTIRLWDVATGQEVARLAGHKSYIKSLAFSPDGQTLVSGSGDGTVRLWDTTPLKARYQARREAEMLRPEADRLVERSLRKMDSRDEVVEALRADQALSEPLRHAAFCAVLRKTVSGKP